MTGTERATPGRSSTPPSRSKAPQASSTVPRTPGQSGPPRPSAVNRPASTSSSSGCASVRSGRRSTHRCSGTLYGGAAPAGSATTARSAPRRSRSALILRPERRDATAGGISSTAVPPSLSRVSACCAQASSDSVRAGKPISQRGS
ncbi:hypothetical protein STREPTOSP366_26390 [Streptomyces variabilis]